VGTHNLAYCVVDCEGGSAVVTAWGVHDLGSKTTIDDLTTKVVPFLRGDAFATWGAVIIENQIGAKMRVVQAIISTFFATTRVSDGQRVSNVSPKLKFMGLDIEGCSYAERKRASVQWTSGRLQGPHAAALTALPKKDDVCDALMQAVRFATAERMLDFDHAIALTGPPLVTSSLPTRGSAVSAALNDVPSRTRP
jgi:hypothetical protein